MVMVKLDEEAQTLHVVFSRPYSLGGLWLWITAFLDSIHLLLHTLRLHWVVNLVLFKEYQQDNDILSSNLVHFLLELLFPSFLIIHAYSDSSFLAVCILFFWNINLVFQDQVLFFSHSTSSPVRLKSSSSGSWGVGHTAAGSSADILSVLRGIKSVRSALRWFRG